MSELISFVLAVLGLGLMVFVVGALAGFTWAAKSLDVTPPRWIAAIAAVAGVCFVVAAALRADWTSAAFTGLVFGTVVAGLLRIGPWRSRSGGRTAP